MMDLTAANYLAALQDDPWDQNAFRGLSDALRSADPSRTGTDPTRLLEFARRNHEVRGESLAAARLMELEIGLVDGDPDFAAVLYRELGRIRRDELMDDAGAIEAYRQALALRPGDEEVQHTLEQVEQIGSRYQDVANYFTEQAAQATDASLKTSLLVRAASIYWQYKKKGKGKEVDRLFKEALSTDPSSARAVRLYELTLRARGKWKELGEVLLTGAEHATGRDERLGLLLAAARVLSKRLHDDERAANCYERVIELLPAHEEALRFLVAYFTERKEWDHLVALYEDALRARQLKPDAEQGILLQIAMVHWKMLGRPEKAEPYFARLRKADPTQPVMLDFYRELYKATGETAKQISVLADAQRRAGASEKLRLSLELARLAQHDPHAAERAIDAYKLVLRHDPNHAEARASLKELYRRSGKWNALVELLRGELEQTPESDRPQRLALLRELLVIYRDELKLDATVLSTYNAILELDPENREASEELSRTYEAMGRWADLIPVLMREAEVEPDPAGKVRLYLRVAGLWIEHFANYNQATAPLQRVLEIEPDNLEALRLLKEIYAKKRAWRPLFEVLSKQEALTRDPQPKKAMLYELAGLAGERLHEYGDAIALWKRVLALEPGSAKALDALEKLAERAKDWETAAEVLEHRVADTQDAQARIRLLTRLGALHSERRQDPVQAAAAWKRVLALDPKNGRALRTLREAYLAASDFDSVEALYAEAGDYEGFVDVLGAAADRAGDPEVKKALSFRAAEIYEQKLNEPARAFRSYERVLSVEPDNERAARALLPIYERDEKWLKVAQLNTILLDKLDPADTDGQLALLDRLVEVCASKLRDGEKALELALRAYALKPADEAVRGRLEQAAGFANAHERLAETYAARADRVKDPEEAVWLRRRVAQIASEVLKRPEQAAEQLEKLLQQRPSDAEAYATLERIYRAARRYPDLKLLLERKLAHVDEPDARFALLSDLAHIEELELADRAQAVVHYREMLSLRPDDRVTLETLDRLLVLERQPEALNDVLARRVQLAASDKERVELTLRSAMLAADELNDVERAIAAFAEVLRLDPSDQRAPAALERLAQEHPSYALAIGYVLEPIYERTLRLDKLSQVLRARLSAAKDAGDRHALKLRLSELSGRLGDPKGAYATLESAFLDEPENETLWDTITHAAEQAGAFEQLAAAFTTAMEMASLEPSQLADLSARTARIYDDLLGQPEKAEPFHRRVLAFDPHAEVAYEALCELYTNRERWEELKALYRERIACTADPQQKQELLLQACFLYEEILDDVEMAIRSYQQVLELDPLHPTSRRALERLYTRAQRYQDLVSLLEGDREQAQGKEVVDLTFRIGELYEHKLKQPARAVDQYADVISAQPTHLRAQEALNRLLAEPGQRQRIAALLEPVYTSQGAHPELAKILEIQLEELSEAGARVGVLMRLGELYERELRDTDQAFGAFARAVESDPSDLAAREELARVATAAGKHGERAALLERALSGVGDDGLVRTEILRELSELWDTLAGDRDKAIDAYARLIASDPNNADVVLLGARALERLHAMAGDFPALADDLRKQIAFEEDVEAKKGLLGRLAELCEQQLSDVAGAIEAYVDRLELDPSDMISLLALERLYESQGQWESLIGVLQKRDAVTTDADEARKLARRIGQIYETEIRDLDHAIEAYGDALSRFGDDRETLTALERVYEATERYADLLEALNSELLLVADPVERAEVRFRAAELMRKRTSALEGAIDAYREVLQEHPGHPPTLTALNEMVAAGGPTRLEAARILAPHYESVQDHEALIRALEVVAESDESREQLEALSRAAEVAETGLGEPARAYHLLARAVKAALAEPELPKTLDELDRLAHLAQKFVPYGQLLGELSPQISDEDVAVTVLMRAAANAHDKLEDPALAREYYERVLALRPELDDALSALERLHEASGDYRGLLEVLRKKTELADEPEERTKLLLRQADICGNRLDDIPAAVEAYERVLEEDPAEAVFEGLEALYARSERYTDLSYLYERQLELEVGDPIAVRFRLAELFRRHLDDPERALDLYHAVLEKSATHGETTRALETMMADGILVAQAAELLEPVYLKLSKWTDLVRVLEAQLQEEVLTDAKKELLGRLAQLHEVQLEDLEAALETYARLFRTDPTDAHTWDALARLSRVLNRQERVAEVYERYVEETGIEDAVGVKLAVVAAQIYDQHGRDLVKASQLYQRALDFDPTAPSVAAALEDVLVRRKASEELKVFYRAQADVAADDGRRVFCLHSLARVLEEDLRDVDGTLQVYREILQTAEADAEAIAALDRLLSELGRYSELAEHLRYQIDIAPEPSQQLPLKLRLARLCEERLDDVNLAVDVYDDITRLDGTNLEARAALERLCARPELLRRVADILAPLYETFGEWDKQIWLSEQLVSIETDVAERSRLYGAIAQLHEDKGRAPQQAMAAWRRALVTDPDDEQARAELMRLAEKLSDWDGLVEAFEEAVEATVDNHTKASLLAAIAQTHDGKRGDPRSAIGAYERLVQCDMEDPQPIEELESLLTMVGDWEGLVELYKRKVERSYDPLERCALWRRAGSVLDELLNDPEGAIRAYNAAIEENADDLDSLSSLDDLYQRVGNDQAVAEVLRQMAALLTDAEERVDVNLRLGRVLTDKLGRTQEAIEAYTHVLDDDPQQKEAVVALSKLFEGESMWADLLENLRRQLELETDASTRRSLLFRIGQVHDECLSEFDEAIDSYRDVLKVEPTHEASIKALLRIGEQAEHRSRVEEILEPVLRAGERWDDLALLLSRGIVTLSDPFERGERLRTLAEIHESGRGDPAQAFESLCEALQQDVDETVIANEVERLAGQLGRWAEAEEAISRRAASCNDGTQSRDLFRRAARIAEQELKDIEKTIVANEQALERAGDDEEILADLDRLYTQTERFDDLVEVLERRVELEDAETAATLLNRLGELREHHLSDLRGALSAYRDALERAPQNPTAVAALERLLAEPELASDVVSVLDDVYREAEELEKVAGLFEVRLKLADSPTEKVALLTELAALWENDVGDFTKAADALKRAFVADPSDYSLLDEIERVAIASGQFEVLSGLVEVATGVSGVSRADSRDLWMRAAVWYRDRLADPERAEKALKTALEADPEYEPAHEALVALYRDGQRPADLVRALRAWADRELDTLIAAERLLQAGAVAEQSGDVEQAIRCYERVLSLDSSSRAALDELIRIYEGSGALGKVVELYERRIEVEHEPERRVAMRMRAAAIRADQLDDRPGAIVLYRAVLDDEPGNEKALDALETLYEESGRWDDLASALEQRLEQATSPEQRATARVRLAVLAERRLHQPERAIDELREVVIEVPGHRGAYEELARLLSAQERWNDLADLLEQRSEAVSGREAVDVLVRLGEVLERRLGDDARAFEAYQRALERDPDRTDVMPSLARLHASRGDFAAAVDTLERLMRHASGERLVEAAYRLAEIAEKEMAAPDRAEAALRKALGAGVQQSETRERLFALCERRGNFGTLADLLADEVDATADVSQKVELLRRASEIARDKLGDIGKAAEYLNRASMLAPDDRSVLVPLCELYIAAGQEADAIPVLERIIASYGGRRVKEVAAFHHMLARACRGTGDMARALSELDAAYRVDLTNLVVLKDLGTLAYEQGDLDRAQKTFRGLLLQRLDRDAPISKADVYFYLGDISRRQGDKQKAISMLQRALAEQAGHDRAGALLTELKG